MIKSFPNAQPFAEYYFPVVCQFVYIALAQKYFVRISPLSGYYTHFLINHVFCILKVQVSATNIIPINFERCLFNASHMNLLEYKQYLINL